MKIACHCGASIPDQTDYLSYKAHLVADQDWEDFWDASDADRGADISYMRACYQCTQCGRLYMEDAKGDLHSFVPEGDRVGVLGSCKGAEWRAPLIATWSDAPASTFPKGYLTCDAEGGMFSYFDDWRELESAYRTLFTKLHGLGRLRSAFLRKNGKDIHTWSPAARAHAGRDGDLATTHVKPILLIVVVIFIGVLMLLKLRGAF